jgi:hypothetical protein
VFLPVPIQAVISTVKTVASRTRKTLLQMSAKVPGKVPLPDSRFLWRCEIAHGTLFTPKESEKGVSVGAVMLRKPRRNS